MNVLDIQFMLEILPKMLFAALVTLEISVLAVVFSIALGILLTTWKLLGGKVSGALIQAFVEFTRGVPQLVQIAIIYFALPRFGVVLNEFWTGVVALTFIGAGYAIEIIRGAVESLDRGQRESAIALGLSELQTLFLVLYPQAARRILPPLTNELANVIKASALLSVISVNELTKVANDIIFEYFVVIEVLIELAGLYIVIIGGLIWLSRALEKRTRA
ncbi:MAG: amino acid ABC transporter permease [Boseongicola sp.]|nr:amino acid ABC transporter permease [Boseongicola sp.]